MYSGEGVQNFSITNNLLRSIIKNYNGDKINDEHDERNII